MIELTVLILLSIALQMPILSIAFVLLTSSVCAACFYSVTNKLISRSGPDTHETSLRPVLVGTICGLYAFFGSSNTSTNFLSASQLAPLLGAASAFGCLVAVCFSLPTVAALLVNSFFPKPARVEVPILRTATLLVVTILMFLFWVDLSDGFVTILMRRT